MRKFVINYGGDTPRRRYTAGQFLAEFAECKGRSKIRDLRHPVRVTYVNSAEVKVSEVCRTASAIFALFQRVADAKGAISSLSWKGSRIGPAGLYTLNHAIRTPARRKGGFSIVRAWLDERPGSLCPLGCDLYALLDYLEIRPVFTGKRAKNAPPSPANLSPEAENAIRYVSYFMKRKAKTLSPQTCLAAIERHGWVAAYGIGRKRMEAIAETMELLSNPVFMSQVRRHRAGKLKFHPLKALEG